MTPASGQFACAPAEAFYDEAFAGPSDPRPAWAPVATALAGRDLTQVTERAGECLTDPEGESGG